MTVAIQSKVRRSRGVYFQNTEEGKLFSMTYFPTILNDAAGGCDRRSHFQKVRRTIRKEFHTFIFEMV